MSASNTNFKWWDNNSNLAAVGRNGTTATAGNTVTLEDNTTNAMGGVGQTVIGTFTAAGSTETIAFSGIDSNNSPTVNAFQLRAIPGPGSLALISLGLILVAGRLRRRS